MRSALFPYRGTVPPFCSGGLGYFYYNADRLSVSQAVLLESCGFRFLAVSGNRKLYSSDEPCYTIYWTGSAYADGWYCDHAEISAVLWCGDRMYFDRNCGAGAFDPTGQGTEV